MTQVAFIGLGVMGYPMAGHIAKAGHDVRVYNRTSAKAEQWTKEFGGTAAPTPAEAAKDCEFVFTCVGNDDDLRSVTVGENGAFETIAEGSVFIDNTTASAAVARDLASEAANRKFDFLDAPVSGGQAGAENGVLTVMIGGDEAVYDRAKPVIDCYARMTGLMGPVGSGQLTKMVNQICIAGLVQGLSEGIHFAQNSGLNVEAVMNVISKGAAQSWQMENRWQTMDNGEYEHGFAVDWMRKDLSIVLEEARSNRANLPVTALVDQFYSEVQNMGGNRWDTSSLLARLKNATKS
ncbi:MAG: NAD(P)-dependent oxidoreductase [Rhizobiaceae bacterium]|nr:NAD(P)-dependent oxidoreductase [Rhizobiaceae bacterium]